LHLDERIVGHRVWRLCPEGERLMFVPDRIRKSVCFLAYDTAEGRKLAGTAFFVHVPLEGASGRGALYLVTAKRVLKGAETKAINTLIYARVNDRNGSYDWIETDFRGWFEHDDDPFVDVAVLPVPAKFMPFDILPMPFGAFLTREDFKKEGIGLGDEVIISGLFVKHHGRQRNVPIIRVGNIAAMPEEKIHTMMWGNEVDIDAYLIEARSIGGLSGSPVLSNAGQLRVIDGKVKARIRPKLGLIGLIHGHWNEEFVVDESFAAHGADVETFNMGIAVVVPSSSIAEVINCAELVERRRALEQRIATSNAPTPDAVTSETVDPTDSDESMTKADFERVLGKVSRRVAGPDEGTS
jgi:hypothetical protein